MATTADIIKQLTQEHLLKNNGLLFGQCVTAVGWVNGTVPPLTIADGIVELPISDVSNGGIAVGAALAGRRPIYVIRFQGLGWYNLTTILNYAAKSKEMWDVPCPIFVRAIAVEGHIGPVASNSHHSLCCRMPGIVVKAPMTPYEWHECLA
jgi:acetoin:2,6-dichlorophenolindophenol oxidoreductase subunit beta